MSCDTVECRTRQKRLAFPYSQLDSNHCKERKKEQKRAPIRLGLEYVPVATFYTCTIALPECAKLIFATAAAVLVVQCNKQV